MGEEDVIVSVRRKDGRPAGAPSHLNLAPPPPPLSGAAHFHEACTVCVCAWHLIIGASIYGAITSSVWWRQLFRLQYMQSWQSAPEVATFTHAWRMAENSPSFRHTHTGRLASHMCRRRCSRAIVCVCAQGERIRRPVLLTRQILSGVSRRRVRTERQQTHTLTSSA